MCGNVGCCVFLNVCFSMVFMFVLLYGQGVLGIVWVSQIVGFCGFWVVLNGSSILYELVQ